MATIELDRRTGDRKRPMAIGQCVETTARYNELVTVCRTQTKPRSDVGGRGEMVGEVPWCHDREDSGTS